MGVAKPFPGKPHRDGKVFSGGSKYECFSVCRKFSLYLSSSGCLISEDCSPPETSPSRFAKLVLVQPNVINPSSLIKPCAVTMPPCSVVYNKLAELQGFWGFSIKEPIWLKYFVVDVYLSFLNFHVNSVRPIPWAKLNTARSSADSSSVRVPRHQHEEEQILIFRTHPVRSMLWSGTKRLRQFPNIRRTRFINTHNEKKK